jgi:hypothetical protein
MSQLKGVIFSLRDVIVRSGPIAPELLDEIRLLLNFLRTRDVTPVFVANHAWTVTLGDGSRKDLRDAIREVWGDFPWYIAERNEMPWKPKPEAMQFVLRDRGWSSDEVVYVGTTENDMITARHARLLFLNAVWHGGQTQYGYIFRSPMEIARFIDCFCLKSHSWFWKIEQGDLRVYTIGPYATISPRFAHAASYSSHARITAKNLGGDASFWGHLLSAAVYFSGIANQCNYVCSYPGHRTDSSKPVLEEALKILADCLGQKYLGRLIVRHQTAVKSQRARAEGGNVAVDNQLNTIHLNRNPVKNASGQTYIRTPLRTGKVVLVVDDICTEGNSLEAARAYIKATGADVISLAWLKTPSRDYNRLAELPRIPDPYAPNMFARSPATVSFPFNRFICDEDATEELDRVFSKYYSWSWPV